LAVVLAAVAVDALGDLAHVRWMAFDAAHEAGDLAGSCVGWLNGASIAIRETSVGIQPDLLLGKPQR